MKIDAVSPGGANAQQQPSGGEKVARDRKSGPLVVEPKQDEKKVAPEEVLDKIKALTEGGLHSVRFEMNDETNDMIVKIFDQDTDELVRQVPAEEVIATSKTLQDYRGLLIDGKG